MRVQCALLAALFAGVLTASNAEGQLRIRDLVFTGGVAGEGYSGNLSAVTLAIVDSTQSAAAGVGEFGARLELARESEDGRGLLDLDFDLGLRQFAATGFKIRDYAPREWVGQVNARYRTAVSNWGRLTTNLGFRGRAVEDRPPMPLFLQPGYNQVSGGLELDFFRRGRLGLDIGVHGTREDYRAADPVPQLDLLDKNAWSVEAGLNWGLGAEANLRFFTLFERSNYPQQGSFDASDPERRDHTLRLGLEWNYSGADIDATLGVEGIRNRSNSRRPEYDAGALSAEVSAPFVWGFDVHLSAVVTGKSYLFETEFARLVPGEEADNASVAYLTFIRPVAPRLDAHIRFGWTRAETDIGDQYYKRYGVTVLFNYRPTLP